MTPIVTAVTPDFLVGAVALRNSLQKNSPGYSLHLLAYGDGEFAEQLDDAGFDYLLNEPIAANLPTAATYPEPNPAMYARLLVPTLFPEHEKTIFMDADAIALRSMDAWLSHDMGEKPCGGTANWGMMSKEIIGHNSSRCGIQAAVMVFNNHWWRKKNILQKCFDAMNAEQYQFKTMVQAVLQLVLLNDWYLFPHHYHVQGAHSDTEALMSKAIVLHFAGCNPWDKEKHEIPPHKVRAKALWASYA